MDLKEMVLKIYEELRSGNEESLKELLRKNEPLFDRFLTEFVSQTPLHIAIQHGSVYFAREILGRKPQLAHVLSSQGFSPLYMASANGSVDIVKELLPLIADVSYDRDSKGWTPVHAAAMKGHINVLEEFKRIKAKWIRDTTDRDETVLHLYVKYNNQVDTLKMLILLVGPDNEFVNRKDVNGNTILHLAAMKKDIPMITYLSTQTGVEINAVNMNGFTALDVFPLYPSNSADTVIMMKELQHKGAERSRETLTEKADNELKNVLMLVGTLAATICFQAAIFPPGGLWQDDFNVRFNNTSDKKNHTAGTSILADKEPQVFLVLQISNYLVYYLSLFLILRCTISRFGFQGKLFSPMVLYILFTLLSVMIYLFNKLHTPEGFPDDLGWVRNAMHIMLFASIPICAAFFWEPFVARCLYLKRRPAAARYSGSNVDAGTQQC